MACACNGGAAVTPAFSSNATSTTSVASLYPGFLDVQAPTVQTLAPVRVTAKPAFPWWYLVLALGAVVALQRGRA